MGSADFEDTFLTVAEVAELLRLNQQTVRNWIDAGSLPALKVGRRVRIRRSDLNRMLESGYRGTGPSASPIDGPRATDFWEGELVATVEPSELGFETEPAVGASGPGASPGAGARGAAGDGGGAGGGHN